MRDLQSPAWMYFKAALLLTAGLLSGILLWIERPTLRTALLLVLTIWSFCRAYYFAFYVVERYIDSEYRFSSLLFFARHLLKKWRC